MMWVLTQKEEETKAKLQSARGFEKDGETSWAQARNGSILVGLVYEGLNVMA